MIGYLLRQSERLLRAPFEVPPYFADHHVLLASFPKSGNTWMRFILANLSRLVGGHEEDVDFHTVGQYVPEIRRNRQLKGRIDTHGFPLFLKTHHPHVRAFGRYRAVVIVRDPADSLVSYYRHLSGAAGKRLPELGHFVGHWRYGCSAWRDWHLSWLDQADCVIRYEDLLVSPIEQVTRVMDKVGAAVPSGMIEQAVERSSKEHMRAAQRKSGDPNLRNENYQFVGKARVGWSRDLLGPRDLKALYECAGEVARRLGYGGAARSQPDAGS